MCKFNILLKQLSSTLAHNANVYIPVVQGAKGHLHGGYAAMFLDDLSGALVGFFVSKLSESSQAELFFHFPPLT